MDISKFLLLLRDKSIYFTRADQFDDPWEAARGSSDNKARWDAHFLSVFREAIRTAPGGSGGHLSTTELDEQAYRLLDDFNRSGKVARISNFVSCWHENKFESEAFWRLYCPAGSAGIAIRTTYAALRDSLGNDPAVQIGQVVYIDFRNRFPNHNSVIFHKRASLQHEKEVRAVIHTTSKELGVHRSVHLNDLILGIVISPFAPAWCKGLVEDLLSKYGITGLLVETSEIATQPFF